MLASVGSRLSESEVTTSVLIYHIVHTQKERERKKTVEYIKRGKSQIEIAPHPFSGRTRFYGVFSSQRIFSP